MTHPNDHDDVVVNLDARRASRDPRLMHLLELRHRLALNAAERRSHALPDAIEHDLELFRVERLIAEGWPEVYLANYDDWLRTEHQHEHPADILVAGCGLCTVTAAAAGVNLQLPDVG